MRLTSLRTGRMAARAPTLGAGSLLRPTGTFRVRSDPWMLAEPRTVPFKGLWEGARHR